MAPTAIKTGENLIYVLPTENESNNFAHKRFFHWTFVICIEIEIFFERFSLPYIHKSYKDKQHISC